MMDKYFKKVRVVECKEIFVNDNKCLIHVKNREDFDWIVTVLHTMVVYYCEEKGAVVYFAFCEDIVFSYKEVKRK